MSSLTCILGNAGSEWHLTGILAGSLSIVSVSSIAESLYMLPYQILSRTENISKKKVENIPIWGALLADPQKSTNNRYVGTSHHSLQFPLLSFASYWIWIKITLKVNHNSNAEELSFYSKFIYIFLYFSSKSFPPQETDKTHNQEESLPMLKKFTGPMQHTAPLPKGDS